MGELPDRRQGAPWWALPFVAVGSLFAAFLELSFVTYCLIVLAVIGIVFLILGEWGWAIFSIGVVVAVGVPELRRMQSERSSNAP